MNDKEFWDLIAWANARSDDPELRGEDALRELAPAATEDFYLIYDRHVTTALTRDVALLAYLVNRYGDRSGRQDLLDFICWLIDQGHAVYRAALADPESLANLAADLPWESEGYWRNAAWAWEVETGSTEREFSDRVGERGAAGAQDYPGGLVIVDDDELRRRWPRLCERFIDEREEDDD
jgi:hypothetical protein